MPKAKSETKAERTARLEVERLEGVVSRRSIKHEDAKRKLKDAKDRQKAAKKKPAKTTAPKGKKKGKGTRKKKATK